MVFVLTFFVILKIQNLDGGQIGLGLKLFLSETRVFQCVMQANIQVEESLDLGKE